MKRWERIFLEAGKSKLTQSGIQLEEKPGMFRSNWAYVWIFAASFVVGLAFLECIGVPSGWVRSL